MSCVLCHVGVVHVHVCVCVDVSAVRVLRTHPACSQVPPDLYPEGYPHHEGTVPNEGDSERTRETSHQSKHAIIHTPLSK